jgi:hypothetical protein
MVQTVEENLKSFTKNEISRAKLARDVQINLGYLSLKDLSVAIRNNSISNIPVTIKDLVKSRNINMRQ